MNPRKNNFALKKLISEKYEISPNFMIEIPLKIIRKKNQTSTFVSNMETISKKNNFPSKIEIINMKLYLFSLFCFPFQFPFPILFRMSVF